MHADEAASPVVTMNPSLRSADDVVLDFWLAVEELLEIPYRHKLVSDWSISDARKFPTELLHAVCAALDDAGFVAVCDDPNHWAVYRQSDMIDD